MARILLAPLGLALVFTASNVLAAGNGWTNLGPGLSPNSVSADGSIVVGDSGAQYFLWTETGGAVAIGGSTALTGAGGRATLSFAGDRVSGTVFNPLLGQQEMGLYDVATGTWSFLGGLGAVVDGSTSSGWGLSGDGSTPVGLGWVAGFQARAITWRESTGIVDLGSTVLNRSTRANAANLDGRVVVGWQDAASGFRQGAVWLNGVQTLISIGGSPLSEAGAVDANGTWVVGSGSSSNGFQAWRWSVATGAQTLGTLNPSWRGAATGISADGSVIVGFDRPFPGPATFGRGFLWSEATGFVDLTDYAASLGVGLGGAIAALPLGISADGRTVVGLAREGTVFGFRLTLPEFAFGYSSYGVGASPANDLQLSGQGTPAIGGLLSMTVDAANGALLIGSTSRAQFPLFGGVALVDPTGLFLQVVLPGNGSSASFQAPIPANQALVGGALHFQAVAPDGSKPAGFAFSNGLTTVISR